jgi:hypothetical protein
VSIVYSARKVVGSAVTVGAAAREPSPMSESTRGAWGEGGRVRRVDYSMGGVCVHCILGPEGGGKRCNCWRGSKGAVTDIGEDQWRLGARGK